MYSSVHAARRSDNPEIQTHLRTFGLGGGKVHVKKHAAPKVRRYISSRCYVQPVKSISFGVVVAPAVTFSGLLFAS